MSSEYNVPRLSQNSAQPDIESFGLHCIGLYSILVILAFLDKVLFYHMQYLSNGKQIPNTFLEVQRTTTS